MFVQGKIIDEFFFDIDVLFELEFDDKMCNCILMVKLGVKMNELNVMFLVFNFIEEIIIFKKNVRGFYYKLLILYWNVIICKIKNFI